MFRLVYPGLRDGFYNTALDEALFSRIKDGSSQSTIIISEWSPTVSIGYSQRALDDVALDFCGRNEIDVVRRYSGGKSVYIDENYIVFSLISAHEKSGKGFLHDIRDRPCKRIVSVLNSYGIPAEFFPPDNIIVRGSEGQIQTLGNSGQKVSKGYFYIHGSVRYDLPAASFNNIIDTLKINGESLHNFKYDARKCLASVRDYSDVPKKNLSAAIANSLAIEFNGNANYEKTISSEEEKDILQIRDLIKNPDWLKDAKEYGWRGICYFFLDGKNIIPGMKEKENPPSRPDDYS